MERFWNKVEKTETCWYWRGAKTRNGYGRFNYAEKITGAHQAAWRITYGDIPEGKWVLHTCDNRDCVRPEHLFLGTRQENMTDMVTKGRSARGTRNWNAKLTEDDVRVIRSLLPTHTQKELCKMFNVSPMQISRIARGLRWKHVE